MTTARRATDPRELVARLNREAAALREREIVAPLLPGGRIRTRLGGLIYEFHCRSEFVGWGRFRPRDEREAEPVGEARPWERGAYLSLLPALRVVLIWPDPDRRRPGTWWALPFNESDAHQRFGLAGADPLPVFLGDPAAGAAAFERVLVRIDGSVAWFDGPDSLADPIHAEWLREAAAAEEAPERFRPGLAGSERRALLLARLRRLELDHLTATSRWGQPTGRGPREQQAWLDQVARLERLERSLRHALAKADATLLHFRELPAIDGSPGAIVVEWSEHGQRRRYHSTIDLGLSVVSSGICLSDRDGEFDLTSLVGVMTGSPWD